jgi:hypothetical protein
VAVAVRVDVTLGVLVGVGGVPGMTWLHNPPRSA